MPRLRKLPMQKNKVFVLLIGASGVGKTTIADYMERNYGLKQVVSYTNRPKRTEDEIGHIFLGEQNVEKIKEKFPNRVAECEYSGHFYFATQEQVDDCDVYVINPGAVNQFKESYKGDKAIKVVLIEDTPSNRAMHMLQRGDNVGKILQRLDYDRDEFKDARALADFVVVNTGIEKTARAIRGSIWGWNVIGQSEN